MATRTFNTQYFSAAGVPVAPYPIRPTAGGIIMLPLIDTVPLAELDEIDNFRDLASVPFGADLLGMLFESTGDGDTNGTPLLDADIVLRTLDRNAVVTDTVLLNLGTFWQAAVTHQTKLFASAPVKVPDGSGGGGVVGFKVVAAAATAADIAIRAFLLYR